jgi:nucleoside 2-deoxyribosyltransferase
MSSAATPMAKPVCYYAGPLFTDAERQWNQANATAIRSLWPGCELLMPQEFCAAFDKPPGGVPDFGKIFAACVAHLDRAGVVLAVVDGADPDSGTCWEIGYAYARGIPVVGLRTDWRPGEDGIANCMVTRSCTAVVRRLDEALAAIATVLSQPSHGHAQGG